MYISNIKVFSDYSIYMRMTYMLFLSIMNFHIRETICVDEGFYFHYIFLKQRKYLHFKVLDQY